jgi:hypothetical protein
MDEAPHLLEEPFELHKKQQALLPSGPFMF